MSSATCPVTESPLFDSMDTKAVNRHVDLGEARSYAMFTEVMLDYSSPSMDRIKGIVGISTNNDGLLSSEVSGSLVTVRSATEFDRVIDSVVTAKADIASRSASSVFNGVEAGHTVVLSPGVYDCAESICLGQGASLVLDGQGDEDAAWIFRCEGDLILFDDAHVVVTNVGNNRVEISTTITPPAVWWSVDDIYLEAGSSLAGYSLASYAVYMAGGTSSGALLGSHLFL
eukprot:gene44678-55597_t